MELCTLLGLSVISLTGWLILRRYRLYSKMAPGPYGFPAVGLVFLLAEKNAIDEFQKYKKKYGKVFSVTLGNYYVTVVTDHRLIIENMKKDEFQGRPFFDMWALRNKGVQNRGILFCDGHVWNEQRRFCLRSLRVFGFGKESMEGMLVQELQDLQNTLRKDLGHPVTLSGVFNASVLNSLWFIVTGKRFELTDPTLKKLITFIIELSCLLQSFNIFNFRDYAHFLPFFHMSWYCSSVQAMDITTPGFFLFTPVKYGLMGRTLFKAFLQLTEKTGELLDQVIDEHLETYKDGEIRDFVDAYIAQIKSSPNESSFHSEEGRENLHAVLFDLFVAGGEATSTTLHWAVLYLCHHPEVQRKAQEEIDNVIGRSRPPAREDKPKLVYLEAVLNEVHRMCSLAPYSVYHRAVKDSEIGGYLVPKDSVIFFSIYDAHHGSHWGDPENFRPERFLNKDGTKVERNESLIPFSSGKRQCLGETLARDTLFMFLAGLLQAFAFEIDPDYAKNDLKGSPTFISGPKPYKVFIKERK